MITTVALTIMLLIIFGMALLAVLDKPNFAAVLRGWVQIILSVACLLIVWIR